MTYQDTLDFMYARLPMFSKQGSTALKNGFDNILALCQFLGHPQENKKWIHVAGTNGKGSVSHMLAAILQTQGYSTGLYTSPHLIDLRERIKINGQEIPEEIVVAFIQKIRPEIERLQPSFFEIMVAMAFDYFHQEKIDIAVIETGLGGRLDSTNIILPIVSVITNIGYDHRQILGNTLAAIAGEKAGIIKPGTPVIIGETQSETQQVFIQKAQAMAAPIFFADQEWKLADWSFEAHSLQVEVQSAHQMGHVKFHLDLLGIYQTKNLITVLETCHCLQDMGFSLNATAIYQGLAHTKKRTGLHGRWEILQSKPTLVLDVAHNEDGMRQVLNQLELMSYRQLHVVLGMVKDKEIDKVLGLLPKNGRYYFSQAQIPRALPATELRIMALEFGLDGQVFESVNPAVQAALAQAHENDLILVCGSVFLVGEVARVH